MRAVEKEHKARIPVRQVERALQAFPLRCTKTSTQVSSYAVPSAHEFGIVGLRYLESGFYVRGAMFGIKIAGRGIGYVGAIV